ncbi:MAG: putative prolipoprotein diacylglyceryl transferase [Cyanobacteria bacterium RYN_339]|nr:putative prolipoprotein diacylglyceryl transferase [Cyanobacteria bacterium RYN_339]
MITYPQIDPVLIHAGPLQIRWYGLMYIMGFMLGYQILRKRSAETKLNFDQTVLMDFAFYLFVGVLLGGRIGYILFYNPVMFLKNPMEMAALWHGGMSFHGGMIGTILSGWFFCYQKKVSFYRLADTVIPAIPVGLGLGRLGNFINGELWGRETNVPWAMIFPQDISGHPRHPSQLYEFVMEGVLLFAILWIGRRFNLPKGNLFWLFITFYGLFRLIGEQFREPDAQLMYLLPNMLPNVTAGMVLSLPMFVGGLVMFVLGYSSRWRRASAPVQPAEAAV